MIPDVRQVKANVTQPFIGITAGNLYSVKRWGFFQEFEDPNDKDSPFVTRVWFALLNDNGDEVSSIMPAVEPA